MSDNMQELLYLLYAIGQFILSIIVLIIIVVVLILVVIAIKSSIKSSIKYLNVWINSRRGTVKEGAWGVAIYLGIAAIICLVFSFIESELFIPLFILVVAYLVSAVGILVRTRLKVTREYWNLYNSLATTATYISGGAGSIALIGIIILISRWSFFTEWNYWLAAVFFMLNGVVNVWGYFMLETFIDRAFREGNEMEFIREVHLYIEGGGDQKLVNEIIREIHPEFLQTIGLKIHMHDVQIFFPVDPLVSMVLSPYFLVYEDLFVKHKIDLKNTDYYTQEGEACGKRFYLVVIK